jgi:hypothetical protein
MRRSILLGLTGLLACAPAAAVGPGSLGTVAPDERYEIFASTGRWTADSVKVVNDTLFARGIAVHPATARTPLALPILSVDSVRKAHTDRSALTSTLVPAAVIVAIGVAVNLAWGSD